MVLVLSDEEIADSIDLGSLATVIEQALVKQGRGEVERPDRPHYPIGVELDGPNPVGMGLVMPAYIHGEPYFATKLVGVHGDNSERGLPTIHAQIVLADARTGKPLAFMNGRRITNARTGCIGGLAARELANQPITLGVLGAGAQARWQTRAIAALTDLDTVRVYSPSDSRNDCAADLREDGIDATAVDSSNAAVADASVVVTATTSESPVFSADALSAGTVVIAVGAYNETMQELEAETFDRAERVFADVPTEVAQIGDLRQTILSEEHLVPLSEVLEGNTGRRSADEILIVESVGTAVLDVATAAEIYEAAKATTVGTEQPF